MKRCEAANLLRLTELRAERSASEGESLRRERDAARKRCTELHEAIEEAAAARERELGRIGRNAGAPSDLWRFATLAASHDARSEEEADVREAAEQELERAEEALALHEVRTREARVREEKARKIHDDAERRRTRRRARRADRVMSENGSHGLG